MTREEAKEFLYSIAADLGFADIEEHTCRDGEKMREAIRILDQEQEPVLDKIRDEIEDAAFDWQEIDGEHDSLMVVKLTDVLDVIDKYFALSEE